VVAYERLTSRGTMQACREHGEVRLEGKEYVVVDGDILNVRFAT
jgi:ribosome-binding ATPase YchF (GTP1/OBG family)